MKQYLQLLEKIFKEGIDRQGRNGYTRALFWEQVRFNLKDGFPAATTKKLYFSLVKAELLWFISGSDDARLLQRLGCHIWDANAESPYWKPKSKFDGDVGRIYGVQWRNWKSPWSEQPLDQLRDVIEQIKQESYSRRHIVIAWNPAELEMMCLPACHILFQLFVADGMISLGMLQRSCDMFLGVPFNIASYALLLHMVAQITGLKPNELVITFGDVHIYHSHFSQVKELLTREPYILPRLRLNKEMKDIDYYSDYFKSKDIESLKEIMRQDIRLVNYKYHPAIKAELVV